MHSFVRALCSVAWVDVSLCMDLDTKIPTTYTSTRPPCVGLFLQFGPPSLRLLELAFPLLLGICLLLYSFQYFYDEYLLQNMSKEDALASATGESRSAMGRRGSLTDKVLRSSLEARDKKSTVGGQSGTHAIS